MLKSDSDIGFKLRVVKYRLGKANVDWAVFAGAAAHYYGSKREVTDFDILIMDIALGIAKTVLEDIERVDVVADLEIKTREGNCRFFMDGNMIERIQ